MITTHQYENKHPREIQHKSIWGVSSENGCQIGINIYFTWNMTIGQRKPQQCVMFYSNILHTGFSLHTTGIANSPNADILSTTLQLFCVSVSASLCGKELWKRWMIPPAELWLSELYWNAKRPATKIITVCVLSGQHNTNAKNTRRTHSRSLDVFREVEAWLRLVNGQNTPVLTRPKGQKYSLKTAQVTTAIPVENISILESSSPEITISMHHGHHERSIIRICRH